MINPDADRFGPGVDGGMDAGAPGADGGVDAGAPRSCPPGTEACGEACVDTRADSANCGACGRACPAGQACVAATCRCAPSDPDCSPIGDPDACGPAMESCGPDEWCVADACACRPGLTRVDAGCVDLSSDPDNCGIPGNVCVGGVCARGECADACPDGTMRCGRECVRRFDPRHCGECNDSCGADEVCVEGDCRDYRPAPCLSCPCGACGEDPCCGVGDVGVICVNGDECPGRPGG